MREKNKAVNNRNIRLKCGLSLVFTVALLMALAACGMKNDPYPEAATLPDKVLDLKQGLTEDGEVILSWKPPKNNMVGRPLKKIGGFIVEMSENQLSDSYCEGCPHQYTRMDSISAASPPPGLLLAPGPYSWRYKLKDNYVYRFKLYSMAPGGGVHPESAVETVVWTQKSPGALGGFSASLGDKSVDLSWARPAKGYKAEVEKRRDESGPWQAITGLDPSQGYFSDLDVEFDKKYYYRARLSRIKNESSRPGPWSREIAVGVADITAPPSPGHLDVALASGGVRLSWESVAFDPDLAGYRVYRQLSGEAGFTRLNSALIKENKFFDPIKFQDGVVARYQITAIDRSPRANESLPSPAADIYLEPPVKDLPRPD